MRRWIGWVWLLSVLAGPAALAQNDLMLSGPPATITETLPVEQPQLQTTTAEPSAAGSPPIQSPAAQGPAVQGSPVQSTQFPALPTASTRVILLLPKKSALFAPAAQAVQAGIALAAERDPDPRLKLSVVETGDEPAEVLQAYESALPLADIIVGPMTRSGVSAIALRARVDKPTLALAQPEPQGEREPRLPPRLLPIGLSAEDEARQMARQLAQEGKTGRAYILHGQSAWQRRAAHAFEQQWRQLRLLSETMEISASEAGLDQGGLVQLQRRLENERPALIFAALDADQASQLRQAIGNRVTMAGTSQLNPWPRREWPMEQRRLELDGVQLLDLPWLLQAADPAVMAYQSGSEPGQPVRSAELERLFALGIDAWRMVREIAAYKSAFELDGVTGRLKVDLSAPEARFTRIETPAVYQDGVVVSRQP